MSKGNGKVAVRVSWERYTAWQKHAYGIGMSLSRLVREVMDRESGYVDGQVDHFPDAGKMAPVPVDEPSNGSKVETSNVSKADVGSSNGASKLCAKCKRFARFQAGFVPDPGCVRCKMVRGGES